jgi:hypothetical protein
VKRTPIPSSAREELSPAAQSGGDAPAAGARAPARALYRIVELAPGGSLQGVIDADGGTPEPAIRLFAADAVAGLFALHHARIAVGRGFRPAGLLLDENGVVKVADLTAAAAARGSAVAAAATEAARAARALAAGGNDGDAERQASAERA